MMPITAKKWYNKARCLRRIISTRRPVKTWFGGSYMSIIQPSSAQLAHASASSSYPRVVKAEPNARFAIGDKFGRLTITGWGERLIKRPGHNVLSVPVRCDCGVEKMVRYDPLSRGLIISCGCFRIENGGKLTRTHGLSANRLYFTWHGIKSRCGNPNNTSYSDYGGRGISVCREWSESFESFRLWATANGYADDLQIDRIDNNGNYEPANCRFVTHTENSRNKRNNRFVAAFGEIKTLPEWAEDPRCKVSYSTLAWRISANFDAELSIVSPVGSLREKREKAPLQAVWEVEKSLGVEPHEEIVSWLQRHNLLPETEANDV